MATLFQIRRGSGSVSLVDGEIYLHKGYNSLQVSSGTTPITLAKINDINSGSLYLAGDVTASNAYFSGDVAISGNLFLGNNGSDNISVPGVFTTNLVPGTNGTLDLGTTGAKWRTLWVNSVSASFSGSVDGVDIISFSTSVDSRLDYLQDFTASVTGGINKIGYFNTEKSLVSYPNSYLGTQTFGLGTSATNSVEPERLMVDNSGSLNIATFQTSNDNTYAQVNIKNFGSGSNASTDLILWNDVSTESSSYIDVGINSSNYTADQVGYAGDGYVYNASNDIYIGSIATGSSGHLHLFGGNNWKSSSITVYTDGTIGINTDKFDNNAETIPTPDYIMEISGNVVFDNNIDVIGNISSSTISGMGGVSQFVTSMQAATASLNTHSQSVNNRFNDLATISGSLILTASANTISITNINIETASLESRAASLATITGSLIQTASNHEQRISNIQSYTSSLRDAIEITGSNVTFFGDITVYGTQSIINSTNLAVADNLIYLNNESTVTDPDLGIVGNYNDGVYAHTGIFRDASDNGIWKIFKGLTDEVSGSIDTSHASFQYADFAANNISASSLTGIGNITLYSTSVDSRLDNLESKSASVDNSVSLLGQYTQSQDSKNSTLQTYTASVNGDLNIIHQTTSSLNDFSASVKTSLTSIYQTTASLNDFSASVTASLLSIYQTTASLNSATASLESFRTDAVFKINKLEIETASLESRAISLATITGSLIQTASLNTISISNLNTETASLEGRATEIGIVTASLISSASSFESRFVTIGGVTASFEGRFTTLAQVTASIHQFTSSLNIYTGATEIRLDELEYTASISVGAGLASEFSKINAWTSSTDIRLNNLELTSQSLNQWSSSLTTTFATDAEVAAGYEAKGSGIFSGSSQIIGILDSLNTYTSSNDTTNTNQNNRLTKLEVASSSLESFTSSINTTIKSKLDSDGVISGSSQVTYSSISSIPSGIVSGSSQVTELLPTGVVSGSTQITLQNTNGFSTFDSALSTITGSLISSASAAKTKNDSQDVSIGTLNTYTSSLNDAIQLTGSTVSFLGNIIVYGTQSIINSTNLAVADNLIYLNNESTVTNPDLGIVGNYNDGVYAHSGIFRDASDGGTWKIFEGYTLEPSGTIDASHGSFALADFKADVITATSFNGTINSTNGVVSGSSQVVLSSTNGGGTSADVEFGSLGIGTTASGISGEIRATGDITAFYSSDIRLKENIIPIPNALEKVNQISGNTYDWKEGYDEIHSHKGNDVGVIAQEIEEILPQIVTNRDTGFKAVQYEKIIPLLIEAIKELSAKVDRLENK